MAKFSITSFLRGINTRVNKFRIQSEESVNSENVDLSNLEIKPQKGLDNTDLEKYHSLEGDEFIEVVTHISNKVLNKLKDNINE